MPPWLLYHICTHAAQSNRPPADHDLGMMPDLLVGLSTHENKHEDEFLQLPSQSAS